MIRRQRCGRMLLAGVALLSSIAAGTGAAPAFGAPEPGASPLGPVLGAAVAGLRAGPVYVHPQSPVATTVDVAVLASTVRGLDRPVAIALLPASAAAEAGGVPSAVPSVIAGQLGADRTVVVAVGTDMQVSSTLPPGRIANALQAAHAAVRRSGLTTPVLRQIAADLGVAEHRADPPAPDRSGSSIGGGVLALIGVCLLGGGLFVLLLFCRAGRPPAGAPALVRPPAATVHVDAHGEITRVERPERPRSTPEQAGSDQPAPEQAAPEQSEKESR